MRAIALVLLLVAACTWGASCRIPAELYWGGYRNMAQLVEPDAEWDFVKHNMDGFFLHGAYWCWDEAVPEVAPKLAAELAEVDCGLALEVGWPHTTFEADDKLGRVAGETDAARVQKLRGFGLPIEEVGVDWHIFIFKVVAQQYPNWTSRDLFVHITGDREGYPDEGPAFAGYWRDYIRALRAGVPDLAIGLVDSPVYFKWAGMPTYGKNELTLAPLKDDEGNPILVDGKEVSFDWDGYDIFSSCFKVSREEGAPLVAFTTDSPQNYTWDWADPVAVRLHREKIRTYERWLHSFGARHTFICNDSGREYEGLSPDDWDARYAARSLEALQKYQAEGGRADRYLFESWYDGPYSIVPETRPNSFTNLVMKAIRYLKGPGETLQLALRKANESAPAEFQVLLTNTGSVACMPALRLVETTPGWTLSCRAEGLEVADLARTEEGYVFTRMLQPGETGALDLRARPGPHATAGEAWQGAFEAFWNPQDPSNSPRASLAVTVTP